MNGKEKLNSFLFSLFGFQKIESRAHFIFIICIHIAAWSFFLGLPLIVYPIRFTNNRFLYSELLSKILPIALFYLNYYFLIPRFFEKRKFAAYFSIVAGAIIIIAVQETMIRHAMRGMDIITMQGPRPNPPGNPYPARTIQFNQFDETTIAGVPLRMFVMAFSRAFSSCMIMLLLSSLIKLAYSFIKNQNEKRQLENEHLNAEVNFLRSQINPHFLFNTLNGIYAQAHNKSDNTEHSILKLSELLRYVLYDSTEEKVSLEKDILYLSNYIDLQKMRLSQKVTVEYEVTGITANKQIAPLLLITFVENAFKHGISYSKPSKINIAIWIFEKTLTMQVTNPLTETNTFAGGGLGLKNVYRRLELIYPGKHTLDISRSNHMHIVNLKINLESD